MATTIVAYSDMDPSPRATLDIDPATLDGSTSTVTVWQLSKWGQVAVRDAVQRPVSGGLVITDYELPPGVPVTYRIQQFDASDVSLGFASLSLAAQVDIPAGWAVMQDPLAPAQAVLVRATPDFGSSLTRRRDVARYQAGGNTFAMSGAYSAFTGVPVSVYTESDEDRDTLASILQEPLVLVRTHPQMRLPGSFYAILADVPLVPIDARFGGDMDAWDLVADEVTRPDVEIVVAVYSYDRFKAYLDTLHPPTPGTYDDAAAIWSTYIDAMRNPPPEV